MGVAESLNPKDSLWHYLAVYLRKERKRRGLTLQAVADIINAHAEEEDRVGTADRQGIGNYEANRLRITEEHARALDMAWDTMIADLREYALKFGVDLEWDKKLGDVETGALTVKICWTEYIPVPLQTEQYARDLVTTVRIIRDVETAVRARMDGRTERLLGQLDRMSLWVFIDERALEPPIPLEHKREQLQALLGFTERATVRIVPDARWYVGQDGNFSLITTASGQEVGYMWAQLGGKLVSDAPDVRDLALRWDRIGAIARTEDETRELIIQKLERLQ